MTEETDYLEVDDIINGQRFVCLSFISPEALMQKRDAFNVSKFLQSYCKDLKLEFKDVYSKYEDFVYKFSSELQRDFDEQNKFQTSLRGIKVRGVYETRGEAESRAKKLQTRDSNFNVFVGDVGKWLPWDPCADNVQDEVFQNSQLNDMMEKYEENNVNKDIFYEEQKRDKISAAREEVLKKKRDEAEQRANEKADECDKTIEDVAVKEEVKEEAKEEIVHKVDKDIKDALEATDPWLASKLKQRSEPDPESEPEPESEPDPEEKKGC